MYPHLLKPTDIEVFDFDSEKIKIPKSLIQFKKWHGEPIKNTFGGKPVVCVNNKPMFAELAIKEYFDMSGWKSRWVETYGRTNKNPLYLSNWKDDKFKNQIDHPIADREILKILLDIAENNNHSYSGCWDILGWNKKNIIFAESKRKSKDYIRQTQIGWLAAGLKSGLKPENFLVVQWDVE